MGFTVGDVIDTMNCGQCAVINILPNGRYEVVFEDGYRKITTDRSLSDRKIKNPYTPTVFGKGFIGEGFRCWVNGEVSKEYRYWIGMMTRCYQEDHQLKNPSYEDAVVCQEWHSFQNFAEWCQTQVGFGNKGWQLDKDLLKRGNKDYSPEFCCFIPKSINASLINYSRKTLGCTFNEPTKRWQTSYFDILRQIRSSATFKEEEQARKFYYENRFNYTKYLIELYKSELEIRVVSRLEEICG